MCCDVLNRQYNLWVPFFVKYGANILLAKELVSLHYIVTQRMCILHNRDRTKDLRTFDPTNLLMDQFINVMACVTVGHNVHPKEGTCLFFVEI